MTALDILKFQQKTAKGKFNWRPQKSKKKLTETVNNKCAQVINRN